jgi:hypothetical protein
VSAAQDCLYWNQSLLSGQRDALSEIRIVTWRATRFFESIQGASSCLRLPPHLNLSKFRGLKPVVMEVREEHVVAISTCHIDEVEVGEAQERIGRKIQLDEGLENEFYA